VIFGVVHWWLSDSGAEAATESALATRLHEMGVIFQSRSSRTMTLRFGGSLDDGQEAFQSLLAFLTDWRHEVTRQFGAEFHVIAVATFDNAFGEL
jgi:hypothetical protein